MKTSQGPQALILFDGVCNLCEHSVQYVLEHDNKQFFQFASLQSEIGQAMLTKYNIDPEKTDSIVAIHKGKAYVRSSAALFIAGHLSGTKHQLAKVFWAVPSFLRDGVYKFVAANRYKWFGKHETSCWLPTPDLKTRFVDKQQETSLLPVGV